MSKIAQQNSQNLHNKEYRNKILTSYFQICIIELPKAIKEYENNKDNQVLQWMKFLDNPQDMEVRKIMEKNQDIKEAKEELDKISQDDRLRRMALKAELERMDQEQRLYEAKRDGKAEGKKEGIKQNQKETAIKMLKEKMDIKVITRITGLTEEEIKKLDSKQ